MADITPDLVWREINRHLYGCLAFVNPAGHPRTAGIVYLVHERKLYIGTERDSWKARHIATNPHVALTINIPKRIPFFPWARIPDASISFHGRARLLTPEELPPTVYRQLMRRNVADAETYRARLFIIELVPEDHFATYGVGVPLIRMADHERARGRCPVDE